MRIFAESNVEGSLVGLPVNQEGLVAMPTGETLSGHWVRLERLSSERHSKDLFDAFAVESDGRLWTYMPHGPFDTLSDLMAWATSVESSDDPLFYAIINVATGRAIGVASYLRINPTDRTIEVGWITYSRELQRTPGATEAMYLMARFAMDLGYRRYEWKCNALNAPSISAAERLGFSFEGVFRNAVIVKGRNRDTAWFAWTDSDWPAIRQALESWLAPTNFDEFGRQHSSLRDHTKVLLHSRWPTLSVDVITQTPSNTKPSHGVG